MKTIAIAAATAALAAAALPALAQQSGGTRAAACTQLELSAGLRGDQCGKLTTAQIAEIVTRRDNPIDRMD